MIYLPVLFSPFRASYPTSRRSCHLNPKLVIILDPSPNLISFYQLKLVIFEGTFISFYTADLAQVQIRFILTTATLKSLNFFLASFRLLNIDRFGAFEPRADKIVQVADSHGPRK